MVCIAITNGRSTGPRGRDDRRRVDAAGAHGEIGGQRIDMGGQRQERGQPGADRDQEHDRGDHLGQGPHGMGEDRPREPQTGAPSDQRVADHQQPGRQLDDQPTDVLQCQGRGERQHQGSGRDAQARRDRHAERDQRQSLGEGHQPDRRKPGHRDDRAGGFRRSTPGPPRSPRARPGARADTA